GIAGEKMSFETRAGIIQAEVFERRVKIHLTNPFDLRRNLELPVDERTRVVSFINTGVPHVVKIVPEIENFDVIGIGRKIRSHKMFMPAGANVNFARILDEHTISIRTYERGVEDETLACGTGAVASAIVSSLGGATKSPISVHTRGKEILTIHFKIEHGEFKETFLEGSTEFVFSGEVEDEALNEGA
ncbi:MAG: diaminopimelate epimerase, partial [Nitrospinota bacterium]